MATISNTSPITTSGDSQNDSEMDLNNNTEDEIQTDTSNWTLAEKKKLQHMTNFHTEYQCIFGEKASCLYDYEKKNIPYEPTYS